MTTKPGSGAKVTREQVCRRRVLWSVSLILDYFFVELGLTMHEFWFWLCYQLADPPSDVSTTKVLPFLILGGEEREQTSCRCFLFLRPLSACFSWVEDRFGEVAVQLPYFCHCAYMFILVFQIYVNPPKALHFKFHNLSLGNLRFSQSPRHRWFI